jgi:hypothetical protein
MVNGEGSGKKHKLFKMNLKIEYENKHDETATASTTYFLPPK